MDIYNSIYFRLNKRMLSILGLWPYDSRRKIIRIFWSALIVLVSIPHVIATIVDISDVDKLMEHFGFILAVLSVFLKHLTSAIAENKMVVVYEDIANNWSMISDEEEKKILVEYSKRGRLLTIGYTALLYLTVGIFISFPLVPVIFNAIDPLPQPRAHVYILHGEFLVDDKDDYFWLIYIWDSMSAILVITIYASVDTMYTVCVEHCAALYAIVTHRLSKLRQKVSKDEQNKSYDWLVHTIKLHQIALSFSSNINDSYSVCFFCLSIISMATIPLGCVLIIINLHDPVNLFRFVIIITASMIHVFLLFWPGQKLIDHSGKLFEDAYSTNWYEMPTRTKTILRIFRLRCLEPCLITAGGLVVMNFENYSMVVKTAVSYITVLASFR